MTNKELANLIFPNVTKTIEDYEAMYPERNLKEGAVVSRFAPILLVLCIWEVISSIY
jgi:glutamyl-tRNA synthetase